MGGPIALIEENDLIEIDLTRRGLNITGIRGEKKSPKEIAGNTWEGASLLEAPPPWMPRKGKDKKESHIV